MQIPTIVCNLALDADGSAWGAISSREDWARVHSLREANGFIAVGARTWNADHPRLLVDPLKLGRSPARRGVPVVFARRTPLDPPSQREVLPIVVGRRPPPWPCRFVQGANLDEGLRNLALAGVTDLFVEGGRTLHSALIGCQKVQRATVYVATTDGGHARRIAASALPTLPPATDARRFSDGFLLTFLPRRIARVA